MIKITERFSNYKKQFEIAKQRRQVEKIEKFNNLNEPFSTTDPIIISGQPRGGTTWLAEVMASDKNTGIIWEPLHPVLMEKFEICRNFASELGHFPYIPEEIENEELVKFFEKVLTSKFIPYEYISWPKNINENLIDKNQWIIKFCRANRMLPWIVKHIDIRPPIYLLRHPCAVVSSQLRHEAFDYMGNEYKSENGNYNDLFIQFEDVLKDIKTRNGKLAAWWAMDNVLPLTHPENNKKWITITYEELISQPEQSFKHLYDRLDLPIPNHLITNLNRPSSTTKPGAMVLNGGNQLEGWKNKLTKSEIKEILDIVHAFGIDLYTDNIVPAYDKIPK
jgi:hypothetical protein